MHKINTIHAQTLRLYSGQACLTVPAKLSVFPVLSLFIRSKVEVAEGRSCVSHLNLQYLANLRRQLGDLVFAKVRIDNMNAAFLAGNTQGPDFFTLLKFA